MAEKRRKYVEVSKQLGCSQNISKMSRSEILAEVCRINPDKGRYLSTGYKKKRECLEALIYCIKLKYNEQNKKKTNT